MTTKIIASAKVGPRVPGEEKTLVVLKWSNTIGFFAVVDGETKSPKKQDGVTDEKSARAWLNMWLRKNDYIA
jgi:hypothetical protein